MYASTPTKLPLATFARLLGLNPLHIAQVYFKPTTSQTPRSSCARVMAQYEWQDVDAVSREEIARAIAEAENNIERELGYRLLPSWEEDEWQAAVRPFRPDLSNLSNTDLRGYSQSVQPNWGWLISGGRRAVTVLAASQAIAWSDADADGYDETGTVVAPVAAGQSACEVRIFYPGKSADPAFEIRPINVSIAGLVATITFRRELAVIESLQEAMEPEEVQGDVDASFLSAVDVYRVYNDPQTQATLMWNNKPGVCDCGDSSCSVCSYTVQTACLNIIGQPRGGFFSYEPADWDASDSSFTKAALSIARQPDIVRLYYYSGLRDKSLACPTRDMDRAWQLAVTRYAVSMLDRPPCGCVAEIWERYRRDLAFTGGAEELATYNLLPSDLGNPFGSRAGAIEAWKRVASFGQANARLAYVP